jgi:hypothetical protein
MFGLPPVLGFINVNWLLVATYHYCLTRSCCNEWFGHRLFEMGEFSPECPLCRQVDPALQPSATALQALEEMQQQQDADPGTDDSNDDSTIDDVGADTTEQDAASPAGSIISWSINTTGGQFDTVTMLQSNSNDNDVRLLLQQGSVTNDHQEGEDEQAVMTEDQSDADDCLSIASSSSSLTNLAAIGAISIAFSSI